MYNILNLHFWALTKGNPKGNGVEKDRKYLTKTATIEGNDHLTHLGVKRTVETSQFAWNGSSLIILISLSSLAAIG